MERPNAPRPSPGQPVPGYCQAQRSLATGYRRRSPSGEHEYRVDDRSMPFRNVDPGNKAEAVPRTINPPGFPVNASTDRNGGLRKRGSDAAGDPDSDEASRLVASSDGMHDRNHELHSQKDQGHGADHCQPLDNKGRQNDRVDGAYRKIISLARSPRHRNAKDKVKPAEGAATQGKIASPIPTSSSSDRSSDTPILCHVSSANPQIKGDQGMSLETAWPCRQKSCESADTGIDSGAQCSVSPISGQSSLATDWEGRFVVNMPSAKEPNPPTMTTEQISDFQSSIESILRNEEVMLDPGALPSLRSVSSEKKPSPSWSQHQNWSFPTRFYSPQEVGKLNGNMTREMSSPEPKGKAQGMNLDGSFLGCKVNNTSGTKTADEMRFSPRVEHQSFADVAPAFPRRARGGPTEPNHSPSVEEKAVVKDERGTISRNLKHVPCSRPSPKASQGTKAQQPTSVETPNQITGKEDWDPTCSLSNNPEKGKNCHTEDDVFIITPTIRRSMITVGYMDGNIRNTHRIPRRPLQANRELNRPQMGFIPSGLRPATQNLQERSTTPSKVCSEADPIGNIPAANGQASLGGANIKGPHVTRGYIHMPGMVKSSNENFTAGLRNNVQRSAAPITGWERHDAALALSTSDSSQSGETSFFPDISPISPTTSEQTVDDIIKQPRKSFEVAELDGHQVGNRKSQQRPRSKITDFAIDFPEFEAQADDEDEMGGVTLPLVFDIFFLSVAQISRLYRRYVTSAYVKTTIRSVLLAAENCGHILGCTWRAFWVYKTTGSWPKPRDKVFSRSVGSVGQGIVNIVALGFFIIVLGRVAWYVVLVGSWVVWFAKPFAWAFSVFSIVGRMLLA